MPGNVTVAGVLTANGDSLLTGNVTLGTANVVGNLNFGGVLLSNGVAYKGSQWVNNGNNISFANFVAVNSNVSATQPLSVAGNVTLTGSLLQNGNIAPLSMFTNDLGAPVTMTANAVLSERFYATSGNLTAFVPTAFANPGYSITLPDGVVVTGRTGYQPYIRQNGTGIEFDGQVQAYVDMSPIVNWRKLAAAAAAGAKITLSMTVSAYGGNGGFTTGDTDINNQNIYFNSLLLGTGYSVGTTTWDVSSVMSQGCVFNAFMNKAGNGPGGGPTITLVALKVSTSTNPANAITYVANLAAGDISVSNINIVGALLSNGSPFSGSQWTTVGNNISFANTVTVGNLNYTGSLLSNGSPFNGSQWTTVGNDISFANTVTAGNLVASNLISLATSTANAPSPNLTASPQNGYTSTASSIFGGGYEAYQAFGITNGSNRWGSASGQYNSTSGAYLGTTSTTVSGSAVLGEWIQLQFPTATYISSVSFYIDINYRLKGATFAASVNGSVWTTMATYTYPGGTVFSTPGIYQYIRCIVTSYTSASAVLSSVVFGARVLVPGSLSVAATNVVFTGDLQTTGNVIANSATIGNVIANSATIGCLNPLSNFPSPLANNTYAGYTVSASSFFNGSYLPYYAFNGVGGGSWASGGTYNAGAYAGTVTTTVSGSGVTGEWLQLQTPVPYRLISYTVTDTLQRQNKWTLAGSTNSTTWTFIDSQTLSTVPAVATVYTPASPPDVYSYYRIIFQTVAGTASTTGLDSVLFYGNMVPPAGITAIGGNTYVPAITLPNLKSNTVPFTGRFSQLTDDRGFVSPAFMIHNWGFRNAWVTANGSALDLVDMEPGNPSSTQFDALYPYGVMSGGNSSGEDTSCNYIRFWIRGCVHSDNNTNAGGGTYYTLRCDHYNNYGYQGTCTADNGTQTWLHYTVEYRRGYTLSVSPWLNISGRQYDIPNYRIVVLDLNGSSNNNSAMRFGSVYVQFKA